MPLNARTFVRYASALGLATAIWAAAVGSPAGSDEAGTHFDWDHAALVEQHLVGSGTATFGSGRRATWRLYLSTHADGDRDGRCVHLEIGPTVGSRCAPESDLQAVAAGAQPFELTAWVPATALGDSTAPSEQGESVTVALGAPGRTREATAAHGVDDTGPEPLGWTVEAAS